MSYSTVKAALISTLQTALPSLPVKGYVPSAVAPPVLCVLLDSYTRQPPAAGVRGMRYRFMLRLYIKWQEFEQAELELDTYVNAIPAAVDANSQFSGVITSGFAVVPDGRAHWLEVSGVVYRVLDTFVEALEKGTGI